MFAQFFSVLSIRKRIIAWFCWFSLLLSSVYILITFNFLYVIEDAFIDKEVKTEAEYLLTAYGATGHFPYPRQHHFSLHDNSLTMPEDMRQQYIDDPKQREFYGTQGRHYHMVEIVTPRGSTMLLAEVGNSLMVRKVSDKILKLLVVIGAVLTFAACFIAYRLANHTTQPLSDLVVEVSRVNPKKLPDNFANHYPENEIGFLARALEQSMQQIKTFVEREQHFTRDASHELRTPIAVVKNAAQILAQGDNLTAEQQQVLERINRASFQMEQTVATLLSLAREQSYSDTDEQVLVLPLVEKAIIQHAYLIEDKPIEVDVDVPMQEKVAVAEGVVQILIANLVSNAFHYTQRGEVIVTFKDSVLSVADTGPGIEPDIQDKLLEDRVKGANSQGFGIGLSIVKRLCEHYGFNLDVASETDGTRISVGFV